MAVSQQALSPARVRERLRRSRAPSLRPHDRSAPARDREAEGRDGKARRWPNAVVADRAWVGLRGTESLRAQQGPRGPAAAGRGVLPADPRPPGCLARPTAVLVRLAGSPAGSTPGLQLLRLGRAVAQQRGAQAGAGGVQAVRKRSRRLSPRLRLVLVIALSAALVAGLAASLLAGEGGSSGSATRAQPGF